MEKSGTVYILASKKNGTLYVGVTSDLPRRVEEHRNGTGSEFTTKYGVKRLVWFEEHAFIIGQYHAHRIRHENGIAKTGRMRS